MRIGSHDGINGLIKRESTMRSLSLRASTKERACEDIMRSHPANQDAGPHQTLICCILISDFPASRSVRSKCLLFKCLDLWYFVIVAGAQTVGVPLPSLRGPGLSSRHMLTPFSWGGLCSALNQGCTPGLPMQDPVRIYDLICVYGTKK